MSKEAIAVIRKAEQQADSIRSDAIKKAAKLQEQAELDGQKLCEETERLTAESYQSIINEMQNKAESLKHKNNENAVKEADQIRQKAALKKPGAVKYIVRGITN